MCVCVKIYYTVSIVSLLPTCRCYFIAQSYLSVKKYKEVLALYERVLDYAQQSLEAHRNNQHDSKSKARYGSTVHCEAEKKETIFFLCASF